MACGRNNARTSTPEREGVARRGGDISEMFKNFSLEAIEEDFDSFYENNNSGPANDFERAAVYEFVESKRKTKYLFDGVNMIKLKPTKHAAVKAALGRAYYLKNLLKQKLTATSTQCRTAKAIAAPATATAVCNQAAVISDFVPCSGPKIPALILNICLEIEFRARSACEAGTYRISGGDAEIRELKGQFMANQTPCLTDVDLHTLTGCIKSFLRGLSEPLIPPCMWNNFVEAGTLKCCTAKDAAIKSLIPYLPEANRDTLAFFVPHLQRISACPDAQMPISNMAIVFAPTIVGFSQTPGAEMVETDLIIMTMEAILNVPEDFWNTVLEINEG